MTTCLLPFFLPFCSFCRLRRARCGSGNVHQNLCKKVYDEEFWEKKKSERRKSLLKSDMGTGRKILTFLLVSFQVGKSIICVDYRRVHHYFFFLIKILQYIIFHLKIFTRMSSFSSTFEPFWVKIIWKISFLPPTNCSVRPHTTLARRPHMLYRIDHKT